MATFVMQALGMDVAGMNTVNFSKWYLQSFIRASYLSWLFAFWDGGDWRWSRLEVPGAR